MVKNDDEHALVRRVFLRLSADPRMAAAPTQLVDELALRLSELQPSMIDRWPVRPMSPPPPPQWRTHAGRSPPPRPRLDENWYSQAPREPSPMNALYPGRYGDSGRTARPQSSQLHGRHLTGHGTNAWRSSGGPGTSLDMASGRPYVTSMAGPSERNRWRGDARVGGMSGRSTEAPVWSAGDWYYE